MEKYNSNSEEKLKIFNNNADKQKELYNQNHLQKMDEIKALSVYTQSEVDYLLADKMDKPYVDITITDNTTIENTLDGNFKIDSIYGNCYQKVETDIVPTPDRPIPITSKKIKICVGENLFNTNDVVTNNALSVGNNSITITNNYGCNLGVKYIFDKDTDLYVNYVVSNASSGYYNLLLHNASNTANNVTLSANRHVTVKAGEYILFAYGLTSGVRTYSNIAIYKTEIVELRSLKESANLFDYRVIKEKGLYTSGGSYISYAFKVKPNTNYYITKKAKIIPTETPDVFIGGDQNQPNGMYLFRDENVFKTTSQISTSGGYIYFKVNSSHWDSFVATIDNVEITITESTSPPPSAYIAPAVRDYKIVDHVNKKAWIERNVGFRVFAGGFVFNDWVPKQHRIIFEPTNRKVAVKHGAPNVISNIASAFNGGLDGQDCFLEYKGYASIYWHPNISHFGLDGTETREVASAKLNEFLATTPMLLWYELATPVIEEIEYLESDASEFGSSSQDSISPSPNIESPIEKVEVLNIKACAKNMFNPQDLSGGEIVTYNEVECYKYIDKNSNFIFDFSHNMQAKQFTFTTRIFREDGVSNGTYMYFVYDDGGKETIQLNNVNTVYTFKSNANKVLKQIKGNYNYAKVCYIDLTATQLEEGEIATTYEPYKETAINHTLSEPLVKCGEITDVINLNNLTRTNNNYFGSLDLTNQGITYGGLVGNYRSYYWRANTMPKPKIVKNNDDKNQLICDRTVANLRCYASDIGETIAIYKDSSADFIAVFNVNRFKDVNEFKQFFADNPTIIAYPLATPVTKVLEAELIEKLKLLKTYSSVTYIFIYGKVKPTINGRYPKDVLLAQQKLETKLLNLQTEVIKNV